MPEDQGEAGEVFRFIDRWSCCEFSARKRGALLEENATLLEENCSSALLEENATLVRMKSIYFWRFVK